MLVVGIQRLLLTKYNVVIIVNDNKLKKTLKGQLMHILECCNGKQKLINIYPT
jgi:hypothetical protein